MKRSAAVMIAVAAIVLVGPAVWAEELQPTAETKAAVPGAAEPKDLNLDWREFSKTTPPPKQYIGGDLWTRDTLSGDWGGLRNDLANKGLTIDFGVTQTLQGNLGGGRKFTWLYQGSEDLVINIDTGKMGLWPGAFFKIHAENQWGNSVNRDTGALLPVNTDSLYPVPDENRMMLSEVMYIQMVSPQYGLIMGKIQPREDNVFANNENTQFMNTAFVFNPALATTVPLDCLAVGVVAMPAEWLKVTALLLDSEGQANTSGFDTAFERGVTVMNNWAFTVKPFGQEGHQRFTWTWSDKSRTRFDQNIQPAGPLPPLGLIPRLPPALRALARRYARIRFGEFLASLPGRVDHSTNDWAATYDFDQYLYTVKDHPDQGFGIFGRVGFGNGQVNPVQNFYSFGVSGKGLVPGRPRDTFGVAYYYLGLSDHLPGFIQSRAADEKGVELYYNIAVTPWMHITPDLQVIDPAIRGIGTTTVFGIRVQMNF